MASYQSPGKSFVALLLTQIEAQPDEVLSPAARRCLKDYARYLERQELARGGDHMLAGLLLNAAEIVSYIPAGKLGKGSMELTRLQERIERVLTAARREEKRSWRRQDRTGARRPVPRPGSAIDEPDAAGG